MEIRNITYMYNYTQLSVKFSIILNTNDKYKINSSLINQEITKIHDFSALLLLRNENIEDVFAESLMGCDIDNHFKFNNMIFYNVYGYKIDCKIVNFLYLGDKNDIIIACPIPDNIYLNKYYQIHIYFKYNIKHIEFKGFPLLLNILKNSSFKILYELIWFKICIFHEDYKIKRLPLLSSFNKKPFKLFMIQKNNLNRCGYCDSKICNGCEIPYSSCIQFSKNNIIDFVLVVESSIIDYDSMLRQRVHPSIKQNLKLILDFWSPINHNHFSKLYNLIVYYFLLSMKIVAIKKKLKIPKFLLYEIIKNIKPI